MAHEIIIAQPDDWHVHLRDGAMLAAVVGETARQFGRAIVMPNLNPPVVKALDAAAYRERIVAALPPGSDFKPLMTAYLTDGTEAQDLLLGFHENIFTAAKLYPAHATTNSAHGVTDVRRLDRVFARMEAAGMPLLVHGEVTDPEVDVFDREAVFIERILTPLLKRCPGLKVVFEHITTQEAADFVAASGPNVAATITVHHLMLNRNALFQGGLRPHHYCLPVVKRERHRLALRKAAVSGSAKFFLGTDTAPHPVGDKESACGCAGIFNAPTAMELYAQVFDEEGALDKLEAFASLNGPRFYGLLVNEKRIKLTRGETMVPERLRVGATEVRPFRAGEKLAWRFEVA
jgi:dihydroorotase